MRSYGWPRASQGSFALSVAISNIQVNVMIHLQERKIELLCKQSTIDLQVIQRWLRVASCFDRYRVLLQPSVLNTYMYLYLVSLCQ